MESWNYHKLLLHRSPVFCSYWYNFLMVMQPNFTSSMELLTIAMKYICFSLTLNYHLDSRWFCSVVFWRIRVFFQKFPPAFWWLQLSIISDFCLFCLFFSPTTKSMPFYAACLKSGEEINRGEHLLFYYIPNNACPEFIMAVLIVHYGAHHLFLHIPHSFSEMT